MSLYHEHEFEAAPGLPEALPVDEHVIWQGAPSASLLAVHALHLRKLVMYFSVMLAVQALYLAGEPGAAVWPSVLLSACLAGVCLLLLAGVAWYAARNTLYTLTNRRWVMRIGMVLTITLNLPFKHIGSAPVIWRSDSRAPDGSVGCICGRTPKPGHFDILNQPCGASPRWSKWRNSSCRPGRWKTRNSVSSVERW